MDALYPLLFGLVGTAVMSLVLYLLAQSGGALAGVRGVGSSVPTPMGGSQVPGAAVHIVAGVVFAYAYLGLGEALTPLAPGLLLLIGALVGVVRGIATSIVLGMLAFDQRPMERMALAGNAVGTVHVIGAILSGLSVSVLFGFSAVTPHLSF
jgi:hypothetical protein